MGECGCGNFGGSYKFPGPNKTWYTLEIYRPCRDCSTPLGVVIRAHTDRDDMDCMEHLPDLPFDPHMNDAYLKVLHPQALEEAMKENLLLKDYKRKGKKGEYEFYETDEFVIEDSVEYILNEALDKTDKKDY